MHGGTNYERFSSWLSARWECHRDHELRNDHWKKNSLYHLFSSTPLGAKPIVKLLSRAFARPHVGNLYDDPAKIHDNSVFLFKSLQTTFAQRLQYGDYFAVALLPIVILNLHPCIYLYYFYYAGQWVSCKHSYFRIRELPLTNT